jgi:hypothetical protein
MHIEILRFHEVGFVKIGLRVYKKRGLDIILFCMLNFQGMDKIASLLRNL